jgi:Trypsin-like peptidase domain/Tetratricopeptide Repeats-Sensor
MPEPSSSAHASPAEQIQSLRRSARGVIEKLGRSEPLLLDEGLEVAKQLREAREFDLLDQLTDQMRREGDERPAVRRLQAQSRIDQGRAVSALDILEGTAARLETGSFEWGEAHGLMGRAWKQIFFDTADKTTERAGKALANSVKQYQIPYELGQYPWHGVNLLALANYAQSNGLSIDPPIDSERLANDILNTLKTTPEKDRDNWYYASVAEAQLALRDLDAAEANIKTYVTDPKTTAFALGGTLRQFTDLWDLEKKGEREHGILQALRAALMSKEGAVMELTPDQYQRALGQKASDAQYEAILGSDAAQVVEWFDLLLVRAKSVGAIYRDEFNRHGTGFLVQGSKFKADWGDELFVVTNAHVVSDDPADGAIRPEEASVKFERADSTRTYEVEKIMWSSGKTMLDAAVLKLKQPVTGIESLKSTNLLPVLDQKQRVYVIGHPKGGALKISFQDNILLDHEGPTKGTPVDPAICHVHYRTPTEEGSSGSPVFNAKLEVIALHHFGGQAIRRLNGKTELWPANEGIWIKSIIGAINRP